MEFVLDGGCLKSEGRIVMQVGGDHIHISLVALRAAGFRGSVRITEEFPDNPIFETEVRTENAQFNPYVRQP